MLNYGTKTKLEAFDNAKEEFKAMMPLLQGLTLEEMRALMHKLKNDSRKNAIPGQENLESMYDQTVDRTLEKELAKKSEKENYDLKNYYRHKRRTLDWVDPKRQPVDERKVVDLLRNQHIFRERMNSEIGTFQALQNNTQFENGLLTYLSEAAYGDMEALIRDVGIKR